MLLFARPKSQRKIKYYVNLDILNTKHLENKILMSF
jgi:hypothetical protein